MSSSTIGGIVGGTIGFFIGGPAGAQWGFMIGSFVGAVVDPDKIYGPRLTDVRDQTASDGVPRTRGWGRFPTTGNMIWRDIVKEIREKQSGKGGPQQITYRYTRSYAIGVCKGIISGYLIIKRNGKIVYDTRTDAELAALGYSSQEIAETRAAQAKFTQIATFYYGDQTTPDPTMVAVKGVGNVPNYTGTAFMVVTDDDVTDIAGAVPQYEFVVADCGEVHEDQSLPSILLVSGADLGGSGPLVAVAEATEIPSFTGVAQSTGADITEAIPGYYGGVWCLVAGDQCRYHEGNTFDNWQSSTIPFDANHDAMTIAGGPSGWVTSAHGPSFPNGMAKAPLLPSSFDVYEPDIVRLGVPASPFVASAVNAIVYNNGYFFDVNGATAGNLCASSTLSDPIELRWAVSDNEVLRPFYDLARFNGSLYAASKKGFSSGREQLVYSNTEGETWEPPVIDIDGLVTPQYHPYRLASGVNVNGVSVLVVLCWGSEYVWTSADGFAQPHPTGIATTRNTTKLDEYRGQQIVFASGRFYIISGNHPDSAKANKLVVTDAGLSFSSPISLPITQTRGITASGPYQNPNLEPIPDAPGYFINRTTGQIVGPPGTTIDSCTPTLGSIVAYECLSRNVTEIDVSELTDPVTGFRIASVSSPQKNIAALMPAYMFDGSEFDGTLHFPKRGRNETFSLTMDDLVERDGDPIQWERTQEPELLRKLTVGYIDPATTFTPTTQQWERRSGTVKAEGESTMELPVVMTADEAAQVAEKAGKIAWSEPDRCTFWLSRQWANLVPAAVGTITDGKGVTHRIRIMRIEDDGGIRMIHAIRDRQDAYESTASGALKPLPLFPGSDIRGPTLAAVMNMPAIRDEDDRPGLYWAANGIMSAWVGARLQVQRAGEWVTLGDITSPSSVGVLAEDLPGHSGDIDNVNTMTIQIDDTLSNVTFAQLLTERNPVAILRPDNTVEVIQFQNATQVSENVWECTTLIRGNLDTDTSAHLAGATVVLLEGGIQFVDLRPDDVGRTLTFRVFSLGTDPDTAIPFPITFEYIWSSTEWPVAYIDVEQDGDDYILTWIERRRLGTDVDPIRSGNWDGYSVSYSYPSVSNEVIVTEPTHTFTLPGASDIDFTVSQLNRLTGRGPETTENVP